MQIRVKLFGFMRDRFGDRSELMLELQPGATLYGRSTGIRH